MGTSVEAPTPRDYGKETADTLRAQLDLAPEKYAAEAKYAPQYQKLQLDLLRSATPELLALYKDKIAPTMGEVEAPTSRLSVPKRVLPSRLRHRSRQHWLTV